MVITRYFWFIVGIVRGEYGYSSVAAVVGATYPEQLKQIREKQI